MFRTVRFPIKYKLASIILVILIPIFAFSAYHYYEMLAASKEQLKSRNIEISRDIAKDLDGLVDKSLSILHALAEHPSVKEKKSTECDRLFAGLLPYYSEHLNILAAGMDGYNYCSGVSSPEARRLNFRDREWFAKGIKGAPVVGNLHTSKLFRSPAVMITVPVFDSGRRQIGVLGLPLNLSMVSEELARSYRLPERSKIFVVDPTGNVLLDAFSPENIGKNLGMTGVAKQALAGTQGSMEDDSVEGTRRLYSFSSLSNAPWKVIVGAPREEAFGRARRFVSKYIVMIMVVSLAGLALSLFLGGRIVRNVSSLITGLKEIEQGNLSFKMRFSGHDELQSVAASFNRMAEERRKADEKVRESESFLSSVLEGIGEGVVVIGRDFKVISANKGYSDQVKMSRGDIIGKYCYEVSHRFEEPCYEKADGCECTVRKCFETGEHHRSVHTHYDREGNAVFIETNAYPLKDPSGEIVAAIETLIDVTGKLRLERQLEETKERYKKLYDDAPDMMHSIDKDGYIVVCNRTEAMSLGYEVEELVGQPFTKIIAPESMQACMYKFDSIRKGGTCEGELIFLAKEGGRIPVFIRAKAIYDKEGNFVMTDAVSRDISEKKMLEAQLLQSQKLEAIGTLTGGIAHDFNNILTAIIGFGSLLQMKMNPDDPLISYVNNILRASGRAANLTHGLLAFGRKQIINPTPVNVNEIVRRVDKLLLRIIGEDIELRTVLADEELTVMADSGQIEQVLMNLCTNARDAMPKGGVLDIRTESVPIDGEYAKAHGFETPGRYARISVTDTGEGMDRETRERIFEPFFTTKEVGRGTGLGLSIVYGIIKQHEGYIDVSSEPGKGTTFTIYLSIISPQREEAKPEAPAAFGRGSETVLVAEDDEEVRRLVRETLEAFGYKVIEAANGEEALVKFRENEERIEALFFDVIMPRMNGREAYEEIRKMRPDIRVVFMSGYAEDFILRDGILEKGLHFIRKPVSARELLTKIREVLDEK